MPLKTFSVVEHYDSNKDNKASEKKINRLMSNIEQKS
jgi:uncharacterized protein YneF (UPF0154 family)